MTFLIPPVLALTTHFSVLKSLSLAQTSASLSGVIGVRFGAAPFAASHTNLPLTVTHFASSAAEQGRVPAYSRKPISGAGRDMVNSGTVSSPDYRPRPADRNGPKKGNDP